MHELILHERIKGVKCIGKGGERTSEKKRKLDETEMQINIARADWWREMNREVWPAGEKRTNGTRRITDECHTVEMMRNKLGGKAVR